MPKGEKNSNNILNDIEDFLNKIMPTNNKLFNIIIIICIAYIISKIISIFNVHVNLSF